MNTNVRDDISDLIQYQNELDTAIYRLNEDKLLIQKCDKTLKRMASVIVHLEHKNDYASLPKELIEKLENDKVNYYLSLED